jgi:thiosulfate sulfurtransferase
MSYKCISVEEAQELIEKNDVTLLDIRDPGSFAENNIQNSINVSNENVEHIVASADKDKPLIVYCYHGNSSKGAADYFYSMGFKKSYSVNGGFEDWKRKG